MWRLSLGCGNRIVRGATFDRVLPGKRNLVPSETPDAALTAILKRSQPDRPEPDHNISHVLRSMTSLLVVCPAVAE